MSWLHEAQEQVSVEFVGLEDLDITSDEDMKDVIHGSKWKKLQLISCQANVIFNHKWTIKLGNQFVT